MAEGETGSCDVVLYYGTVLWTPCLLWLAFTKLRSKVGRNLSAKHFQSAIQHTMTLSFNLKCPIAQLQNLSFTRHVVMQKYIIHLNLTMSSLASFLFSAAGLVFLSVSGSWKLKYQCKKVSTRVGIGEKNQSMNFLRRTRLQKMGD